MTSSQNPTWYDVLGVPHDATPEQIKAAWRNATDKFEPGSGSGQFRMFNDAADVLLDPARRAEYDASLDDAATTDTPGGPAPVTPQVTPQVTPPAEESAPGGPETHVDPKAERRRERAERRSAKKSSSATAADHEPASRVLGLVTLGLALLTVAALVAAGYFGLQVRKDAKVADARDRAPASAERAAKSILEYDYRRLPADRKRASAYLTPDFRKDYLENFTLLEKQKDGTPGAAVQTKTVVTASVLGSGVMDADADRVRVLVYVNQESRKPGVDPQIFQNRVALTMEKDGNRWLVDDLKSY